MHIEILKGEEKEKKTESLFKEIMDGYFPNMGREINEHPNL